jgi:hypothetical protein
MSQSFAVDLHLRRRSQFNESWDFESFKVFGLEKDWGAFDFRGKQRGGRAGGLCGRS